MSRFSNFKDWIFKDLFPSYFQANDTYKDQDGKGILERFIEVCAEYFDNSVQPDIDNIMDNIDFDETALIFLNQIWEYFDSIPYAYGVLVKDNAYAKEEQDQWTKDSLGFPRADARRILRYAISLFKIRGTQKFYTILGRFYGVEISLTPTEVSDSDIVSTTPGPIEITIDYGGDLPAEGGDSFTPNVSYRQVVHIVYKDETEEDIVYTTNGILQFSGEDGIVAEKINPDDGTLTDIPANETYERLYLGKVNVNIVLNGMSADAYTYVYQAAKEDVVTEKTPTNISLEYTTNPVPLAGGVTYPYVRLTETWEYSSGKVTTGNVTIYNYENGDNNPDFVFTDLAEKGFMDSNGTITAGETDTNRVLGDVMLVVKGYEDTLSSECEVLQQDVSIVFYINFEYPEIPASGGTVKPTLTVQAWDGVANLLITDSPDLIVTYEGEIVDEDTGEVTVASRTNVTGVRWVVDHVTATFRYKGNVATQSADVYQEANEKSVVVSSIDNILLSDYRASSGSGTHTVNFSYLRFQIETQSTYTSGYEEDPQTWSMGDDSTTFELKFSDTKGWVNESTGQITFTGQQSTSSSISIDTVVLESFSFYYAATLRLDNISILNVPVNKSMEVYQTYTASVSPDIEISPKYVDISINETGYTGSFTITPNDDCTSVDLSVIPWGNTSSQTSGITQVQFNSNVYTSDTARISVTPNEVITVYYEAHRYDTSSLLPVDMSIYFTPRNGSTTNTAQEFCLTYNRSL